MKKAREAEWISKWSRPGVKLLTQRATACTKCNLFQMEKSPHYQQEMMQSSRFRRVPRPCHQTRQVRGRVCRGFLHFTALNLLQLGLVRKNSRLPLEGLPCSQEDTGTSSVLGNSQSDITERHGKCGNQRWKEEGRGLINDVV